MRGLAMGFVPRLQVFRRMTERRNDFSKRHAFEGVFDRRVDLAPGPARRAGELETAIARRVVDAFGERNRPVHQTDDIRNRNLGGRARVNPPFKPRWEVSSPPFAMSPRILETVGIGRPVASAVSVAL